jgi:hypothetical protein
MGEAITDAEAEIRHGTKIGRFVVVGELGKGGMGVVYAAHDRELDRQVALKVLRAAAATDEERMRMLREGQAMARVTHPNVITVYEVGVEGTLVFLAQELLDAGTLGGWLEGRRSQSEIIATFAAAGRGLAAAHAAGLVHRDFKPDNVLLGTDGRVRVADFGLARALDTEDGLAAATRANMARAQLDLSRSPMSPLTRTGAVMGTPMFMAPEQHNGERADERSDQFSFCVALYHALYGDWPFAGKTAVALADAVIEGRLQRAPRGHHVPARLRRILVRGLATKPADRYPSMEALLAELTRPPSRAVRRVAIALGALALVATAVVGGYALRSRDEPKPASPPAPTPIVAFDPRTLTDDRGIAWLLIAIERGQLDDAFEKYAMAAALLQQGTEPAQTSIAWSAGTLVLALRGHLDEARTHLRDAGGSQGQNPLALAYVDLASAALLLASGDLVPALEHSASCARRFTRPAPELAALCFELHGDAATAHGDVAAARKAYADGLAIARRGATDPRTLTLELALAALDLDDAKAGDGKAEQIVTRATDLEAAAAERGAVATDAQAWTLIARAHIALAASQQAIDDLAHVKPGALEAFQLRIEHQIAAGQATALASDPDEGVQRLDAARAEADAQGFPGLALAARLARVELMVTLSLPDAARERRTLVIDAREHGYLRIAHLAETIEQR